VNLIVVGLQVLSNFFFLGFLASLVFFLNII
jgi:hypothetical protein